MDHELLVVGGNPAALSLAVEARRAGLERVAVIAPAGRVVPTQAVELNHLTVFQTGTLEAISGDDEEGVVVKAGAQRFTGRVCAVDITGRVGGAQIPWQVPESVASRVHTSIDFPTRDQDVLVVGSGERAVVALWELVERDARPVLCLEGAEALSHIAEQLLEDYEREQRATILWHSTPSEVVDIGGFPMAVFDDRRTPDLQFDHVVVALPPAEPSMDLPLMGEVDDRLYLITEDDPARLPGGVAPAGAWAAIRQRHFPELPEMKPRPVTDMDRVRELRAIHYNATITSFDTAHNELWRIRVRPDEASVAHRPGQYCTLGVGYWEPRVDDAIDPGLESKREKLIRRSYSISSPIFGQHGYLADPSQAEEIELYIVLVRAEGGQVPGLTPRLALMQAGDRVYLGPKVAGRYSLDPVTDPAAPILFCATGTGEAPHNEMIVELLRKGHYGPILSVVSVRYWSDLAYRSEHEQLTERYPNYRYHAIPTREPDIPKRYVQDHLEAGTLEERLGAPLDPERAHVFLCGNPAMIGLPEWDDDGQPHFPSPAGMAELLHRRGFVLDQRKVRGNVHYEEYW